MVEHHNIDDTDQPADLSNPTNRRLHEAAQRMLVLYPYQFSLNLDRQTPRHLEQQLTSLIEKTIAGVANLANGPRSDLRFQSVAHTIKMNPPPNVRITQLKVDMCSDDQAVSAYVVIEDFNGNPTAFEVEMGLQ